MKPYHLFLAFLLFTNTEISAAEKDKIDEKEAEQIADSIYIYGYPLIMMDLTSQVMTNVVRPEGGKAPMGQFAHTRIFPDASFKDVTAPNVDTLYSLAWLDLSKEPYILHLPKMHERYYLISLLSGWTEVFQTFGTRTAGEEDIYYAITGPNWVGKLPLVFQEVKSPTDLVWILGRIYCNGTSQDCQVVHLLQDRLRLIPLSAFGKPYKPPTGVKNSTVNIKVPVREQVDSMEGTTFFKRLAFLMMFNPPSPEDKGIVDQMKKIGMFPGREFFMGRLNPEIANKIQSAPKRAQAKIMSHEDKATKKYNGWQITTRTGNYRTDYLQRAHIAAIGLGANKSEDTVYLLTHVDLEGNQLNGRNKYVIHFSPDELPPAKGFWSLTMYNDQYFFVDNPIKRYAITPRNDLLFNLDGSLDIFIQKDSPNERLRLPNWLPAPAGNFILMMRLYWPDTSVLNGSWKPPAVEKVKF